MNWLELGLLFVAGFAGGYLGVMIQVLSRRRSELERRAVVALERIARAHRLPGEP